MNKGTEELIASMKAAAEKATCGKWSLTYSEDGFDADDGLIMREVAGFLPIAKIKGANAEFIQAAQPENVLALIAALEQALAELQEYRKASKEPVAITHDMAMAFHNALNDGGIGHEDLEKISIGLRAALANYAAPPLQAVTVPDEKVTWSADGGYIKYDDYDAGWNACRAAMLAPPQQ